MVAYDEASSQDTSHFAKTETGTNVRQNKAADIGYSTLPSHVGLM